MTRSGELFAGVGGLGMAVDAVFGSTPAWFCEFDAAPSKVLAHRYPDVPNFGDVRSVDWANVEPVQILAGGFPCQDVSLAGRRRGMRDGTRSGLWSEFARAIDIIRPDWVVIENVRGLLSADAAGDVEPCPWCLGDDGEQHALRALGAVLGDLAELGFDAEWTGIRAADVGAPHGRFRVFILAWPASRTVTDADRSRFERIGRSAGILERDSDRRDRAWSYTGPLSLLPTPTASEGEHGGPGCTYGNGSPTLGGVGALLPTPAAMNPNDGEGTDTWLARRERVKLTAKNGNGMGMPLSIAVQLLPTPRTTDMNGAGAHGEGAVDQADGWGPYAGAVNRWCSLLGRPAPVPVRYDGKGGKPRLNPELPEWMMGWPLGWVTASVIGLTRAEQLKCAGNGVVPQQAAAALLELLARPGVPAREWRLAA